MVKLILGFVVIIGLIVFAPQAYNRYVVWDASDPKDDDSAIDMLLIRLTPSISPSLAKQAIELNAGAVMVDVRSKQEYDEGHISGAILIPEETLYQKISLTLPDKTRTVYLYCQTGQRGAVSTRLLRSMGYDKAYNLENGINGWKAAGNKIDSLYSFPE